MSADIPDADRLVTRSRVLRGIGLALRGPRRGRRRRASSGTPSPSRSCPRRRPHWLHRTRDLRRLRRPITFTPTRRQPTTGLVLYPGGKVPPAAYAPQARAIAELGYLVVIVSVPFNLAVFDIGAAAPVIAAHPEIEHWVVGGHSLGGSMAAQFLGRPPGAAEGLVLWAAYSAADLSDQDWPCPSIYGTLDAGIASYTSPSTVANARPRPSTFTVIEGGNHEQMGWYTGQPNDPPATITRADSRPRSSRRPSTSSTRSGRPVT